MSITLMEKAEIGFNAALDKKALNVSIMDIRETSSVTDFFMVCSGESTRQVQAIADEVSMKLKELGIKSIGVEGYESARWVLLDYSDMVFHIFHEDTRKFYDLERLWEDAPRVEVREKR